MARQRKEVIEQPVEIELVTIETAEPVTVTPEHSGVETWLPAAKASKNSTVVVTDETRTVNGVLMVKCFYKTV